MHSAAASNNGNGVYHRGSSAFPTATFEATNYWVDVVFMPTTGPDTTPPVVLVAVAVAGSRRRQRQRCRERNLQRTAADGDRLDERRSSSETPRTTLVSGTVAYDSSTFRATFTPSATLAYSSTYTATVKGGGSDPRIKDAAGNALTANVSWSFTTSAPPPPPPDTGPGGPILVVSSTSNPFSKYYAEILRTEGLNAFAVADINTVTTATLANYDVVLLGDFTLTSSQVSMFTTWVDGGGNLIAMHPSLEPGEPARV